VNALVNGPGATTAAAAAAAATGAIIGFVDTDGTTIEVFAVHFLDGRLHDTTVVEGDKSKTAGPSGVALGDHLGLGDGSELFKGGAKPLVRRSPR
jgi:hypothetical protein